uniref:Reelin domain-containing protein n=1 Tax=Clastoptera arizonana TaxID=38151 RepID=A0A1B6D152_9HEMI
MADYTYLLIPALVCQAVLGRPDGADKEACLTMIPGHDYIESQKTAPPYIFEVDDLRPSVDQKLTFTIRSKSEDNKIGGFMVQARDLEFISNPFGTFDPVEGSIKVFDCLARFNSTATHTEPSPKDSVSMTWNPPKGHKGPFRFYTTVAKTREIFWVSEPSPVVKYVESK